METDAKDYLYSAALIGLVLAATALVALSVQDWLASIPVAYASVALLFLLAGAYGGFTALSLAGLAACVVRKPDG